MEAKQLHSQRKVTQKRHKKAQSTQQRMLRLWSASERKMHKREVKEKHSFLCEDSKRLGDLTVTEQGCWEGKIILIKETIISPTSSE